MNLRLPLLLSLAGLLLAGCGKNESSSSASSSSAAAASSGPREIDISAADNQKYSLTQIDAKPGEDLKVVLTNVGTVPKNAMAHNWVLLNTGDDATALAFDQAAASQQANGYIPANLESEILAKIPMQGPKESGEVEFKAPTQPGNYIFLCTFPAHYQVGMHGVLTVK
ncbi:MAG TPA: plastocyanin/azurin family copper-binding protein [Opitutaceae bacterium]|nr:plastocyanin/azurin family copper-binding protein [Opitutaceae bacterium]